MKILILAPHPFYQPRGTPIAVDLLARALSERGDEVDVLTYHEGSDRSYARMRIHRIRPFIRIQGIRPGLSVKKLYCDLHLFFRFISLVKRERYDLVHAVEESVFMALLVCGLMSKPFVYDMDSSMTTQVVSKLGFLRPVTGLLRWMESLPMRHAAAVVSMCDALAQEALRAGARHVVVLKDISLLKTCRGGEEAVSLRRVLALPQKIAMYIGNLESYQGIDLMLESFTLVRAQTDAVALIVIGGVDEDIRKYRALALRLGIGGAVYFIGPRPVEDLGQYMAQADILISPRTEGLNTPMKIYSYLDSGVPVLATDLPTHTQVMNRKIAMLAPPEKYAFAQAMIRLIENESLGAMLADQAKHFIEREYSYTSFRATLYRLFDRLEQHVCA
jgi:glycosyltransferase involved in cell wall biosynthesis